MGAIVRERFRIGNRVNIGVFGTGRDEDGNDVEALVHDQFFDAEEWATPDVVADQLAIYIQEELAMAVPETDPITSTPVELTPDQTEGTLDILADAAVAAKIAEDDELDGVDE